METNRGGLVIAEAVERHARHRQQQSAVDVELALEHLSGDRHGELHHLPLGPTDHVLSGRRQLFDGLGKTPEQPPGLGAGRFGARALALGVPFGERVALELGQPVLVRRADVGGAAGARPRRLAICGAGICAGRAPLQS